MNTGVGWAVATGQARGRLERRQKMRETLNSMSSEALRYCRIEHKSRWLTRLIVVHADKKVFAFDGIDPLTRRRFKMHLEFPLDVTLSEFLTAVMNCADAPITMRLDCAKNAATLMHEKPKPVITLEQRRERKRLYMRKRYHERLSAVVATDAANPPVAEG